LVKVKLFIICHNLR